MKTIFLIVALAIFAWLVLLTELSLAQGFAIIAYGLFMRLAGLVDEL